VLCIVVVVVVIVVLLLWCFVLGEMLTRVMRERGRHELEYRKATKTRFPITNEQSPMNNQRITQLTHHTSIGG
jgi:hypothetical protein